MAITLNAVQSGSAASEAGQTTLTYSFTVASGDNRILIVGADAYDGAIISGITFNGDALTEINNVTQGLSKSKLFYLIAPDTGAHDIVVTANTGTYIHAKAVAYNGVLQTEQPDSNNTNSTAGATSLTTSTTVITNNSWLVLYALAGGVNPAAGTGATLRGNDDVYNIFDSNGGYASGSRSIQTTTSGSVLITHNLVSIKPALDQFTIKTITIFPSLVATVGSEFGGNTNWYTAHDATTVSDSPQGGVATSIQQSINDGRFARAFMLFDTSVITSEAEIITGSIKATFNYVEQYNEAIGSAYTYDLVGSSPASTTTIVQDDYDQLGTTLLSNITPQDDALTTNDTVTYTLNTAGLNAISKTGISKFGWRTQPDRTRTLGTGRMYASLLSDNSAGAVRLELTYAIPSLISDLCGYFEV